MENQFKDQLNRKTDQLYGMINDMKNEFAVIKIYSDHQKMESYAIETKNFKDKID